jgi:CBS domain containing-hemolysin-like protein
MTDDPQRTALPAPVAAKDGGTTGALAGLWTRVKAAFGASTDASLRASLEGVIEQHGAEAGASDMAPEARSMLLNLLEFGELRVDDVMVPRVDIIAIEEGATIGDLLSRFTTANHSRLPVFRETLDEPVGMVHIKDFVRWVFEKGAQRRSTRRRASSPRAENEPPPAAKTGLKLSGVDLDTTLNKTALLRDLLFVPPSMPAADLLVKMQATHIHMAIVVDEYGGTDGLVSIEDLVEEIVGDIADEHDGEEGPLISPPDADGILIANARAPIEELEAMLGVALLPPERESDADTLGGLMFSMLGRVPVRGEIIRHESGLELEVVEGDLRRLKKIRIHTRPRPAKARRSARSAADEPAAPGKAS